MPPPTHNINYFLGEKLLYIHEAVYAILQAAPGGRPTEKDETSLRKDAIEAYTKALLQQWSRAFGPDLRNRDSPKKFYSINGINKQLQGHLNKLYNFLRSRKSKSMSK